MTFGGLLILVEVLDAFCCNFLILQYEMNEWKSVNSNNKHVFISYVECLRLTTILILSTSQMSHLHLLSEASDAQLSNVSKVSNISASR